ncbi:hypothetical protein YC2023_078510 [Brassica napus]
MAPGWLLPTLPHFETPLHGPCLCSPSEGFGFPYGELPCVSSVGSLCLETEMVFFQLRELLFGSQRLQVWGDSRLQSLIALVARLVLRLQAKGLVVLTIPFFCWSHYFLSRSNKCDSGDLMVTIQKVRHSFRVWVEVCSFWNSCSYHRWWLVARISVDLWFLQSCV